MTPPALLHRRILVLAAVVALAGACQPAPTGAPGPSAITSAPATSGATIPSATAAQPAATADRASGWRSDLALVVPGMEAIHPDLFHGASRSTMTAAVDQLTSEIDASSDDRLMVGVARVAAMVSERGRDGHTGLFVWGTGTYPVDSLPLRLWLFDDEVVVVDALAPYEDLVDSRIDSVEGRPIAEVLDALEAVIPRDNAQTIRLLAPRYLLMPQVLRGLGIAGDGPIALGLTSGNGSQDVRLVEPVPMADYNAWAGPYGLHLPVDPDVLYLSDLDDALWWRVLPDTRTLYVQYNRVEFLGAGGLDDLRAQLRDDAIERVVLDLRHNYGGEVSVLSSILGLFTDPAVDREGELFVITGRNTFSAASMLVARLDAETSATIVGEPMSGSPTTFGDPEELQLPFSGLVITVSTLLEVGVDEDDDRATIDPDLPVTLTREAWEDGIDPALEAITITAP